MSVDPTDHEVTDSEAEWRALRKENAALREALERLILAVTSVDDCVAHFNVPEILARPEIMSPAFWNLMANLVEARDAARAALTGAPRDPLER